MPVSGCSSAGLALTALAALLLLPTPYLPPLRWTPPTPPGATPTPSPRSWLAHLNDHCPPVDLFLTLTLLTLGLSTYLAEWIQRKIMERRIIKMNQYLGASVERLRAWDSQQAQLESTLRMVQGATTEYNLLLYLLLRRHGCAGRCRDKQRDHELSFLRNPSLDV